jgi:MFS family permease
MNESTHSPEEAQRAASTADYPHPPSSALRNGHQSTDALSIAAPPRTRPSRLSSVAGGFQNTFSSLSNRHFLFLWLGMLFLMAGTQMQMLARGYLVYDLTNSGTILGIVNLGIAVPMLTIPLFGGAIADRMERKAIIQIGQLVAAVLGLVIGIMIHTGTITWPYIMVEAMVQGSLFAFMMPARQAIIPQLVGQGKLTNAMAINAAGMSAMTMAAPALAGWLYAYAGPWNVYYVIAALCFASVVLTGLIPKTGRVTGKNASMLKDIGEGLAYVRQRHMLTVLLLMGLATTMLAMPFRFIMPVFVVDIYQRGPDAMGLLVGIMGLGAMAGALYVAAVGRRNRGLLLIMASFMSGIGLLLVALVPIYSVAVFLMILLGLGDAGRMTLNQALIIEEAEDRYRGRVMSIFMLNFGLMPLGVLPAGVLTDYLGGQVVLGAMALMLLAISAFVLLTQKRLRAMP